MSEKELERILETEQDEAKVEKAIAEYLKGAKHELGIAA